MAKRLLCIMHQWGIKIVIRLITNVDIIMKVLFLLLNTQLTLHKSPISTTIADFQTQSPLSTNKHSIIIDTLQV